jgi:hypothetical protein
LPLNTEQEFGADTYGKGQTFIQQVKEKEQTCLTDKVQTYRKGWYTPRCECKHMKRGTMNILILGVLILDKTGQSERFA